MRMPLRKREEIGPEMVVKRLVGQGFLVVQTNWARKSQKIGLRSGFHWFFSCRNHFSLRGKPEMFVLCGPASDVTLSFVVV